ncbi:MAG: hypothetical protein GY765_05720 [bacterium]|nr:hypothetical protein [bacterium]
MKPTDLNIILPCAGEGTRLGLESPKELYEILPGRHLVDFSLDHIKVLERYEDIRVSVAVVIRPWKEEVYRYISDQLPGVEANRVFFDDGYDEWPGSVFSAASVFAANNLVLLPDSLLHLSREDAIFSTDGVPLGAAVLRQLAHYKVVFGSVACIDPQRLKRLGAMGVEAGRVVRFQDKPSDRLADFNSFWGCYAFRKACGRELYDFLVASVRHQPVALDSCSFHPAGTVRIESYRDLGTWNSIEEFRCNSNY